MKRIFVLLFLSLLFSTCEAQPVGLFKSTGIDSITSANDERVIMVIGDSNAFGSALTATAPTPSAGTVYDYDGVNINEITAAFISSSVSGTGRSSWVKFGIDYNTITGKKVIIVNTALSSSAYNSVSTAFSWETNGPLYERAKLKTNRLLYQLGVLKPAAICINLGINDGTLTLASVQSLLARLRNDYYGVPILMAQVGFTSVYTASQELRRKTLRDAVIADSKVTFVASMPAQMGAGQYETGSPHLTQTGYDNIGASFARYFKYKDSGYSKWALSIICSQFDDPTSAHRTLINNFISTLGTYYFQHDVISFYKTTVENNIFIDWTFISAPQNPGGATFTANSHITTNGTTYFTTGMWPFNLQIGAIGSDCFVSAKVKTNRTAQGTEAWIFGGQFGGTSTIGIRQTTTPELNFRLNGATGLNNTTDLFFGNNTSYSVARSGAMQSNIKNGTVLNSATSSSSGSVSPVILGGLNTQNTYPSATISGGIDADFEWFRAGKFTTIDESVVNSAFETLVNNW